MFRHRLTLLVVLMALVAACGGSVPSGGETAMPASPSAATEPPAESQGPAATEAPATSEAPVPTEEPIATEEPAPTGSDDPPASGEPTEAPTGAEACSGSADNRDFFLGFAKAVDWPVLCGVLPRGWFVSQGSYRLANGGKLLVSYKGPDGASIALSQGAFCTAGDGCVPSGTDLGAAALGPLDGTLYEAGDGYAIIAAPGENPSWLMTTSGLGRDTTEDLGAALAEVGR